MKKNKRMLTPAIIADLAKSGLSAKDGKKLGIRAVGREEMRAEYYIDAEGYEFPYGPNFRRVKILKVNSSTDEKTSPKYKQKSKTTPALYLPNLGRQNWKLIKKSPNSPIVITEGEKKAAAGCKVGLSCIGLGGVWCFRSKNSFLKDWDEFNFKDRDAYIVFDSDIADKPGVRHAEYTLAMELMARGAKVKRIRLHSPKGEKVGLDDFLVKHGLRKNIQSARKAFMALPSEEIDFSAPPHLTELGNAIRFAQSNSDTIRFIPQHKKWIKHDSASGLWKYDEDGEAMRRAKALPHLMHTEAKKLPEQMQKPFLSWAKASESSRILKATINLAESEQALILSADEIDADPWSIAAQNKTVISLKTIKARETLQDDYFMKSIGTIYDLRAKYPQWLKFLRAITNNDHALIGFLQRAIGYSLTGNTSEQCFFVLWGIGANGKSTFLNTLLALFGECGRQASPDTFMMRKNPSAIRSDVVRLSGVRLITTSEVEDGQRISESLIKQWTGGESISARDLYAKTSEFKPIGKIWLATNHKPKIYGVEEAIWRRVILIPFARTFSREERDPHLGEKLLEELPGILNWALEGCRAWQKKGLGRPHQISKATKEYRSEMDWLGAWLQEKCVIGADCKELIGTLYESYEEWAKDSGEHYVLTQRDLSRHLVSRGFIRLQTTDRQQGEKGWFIIGVSIKKKRDRKFA